MSQLLINDYYNEIERLRKFSGSSTEGVVSQAFARLLNEFSRQNNWVFVQQAGMQSAQRTNIRPDGVVFTAAGMAFGYWEAKDSDDDLDVEIAAKIKRGYPTTNIIFENTQIAVLYQNGNEVLRCPMNDGDELLRLVTLFFDHESSEIHNFNKAIEQFREDLPLVLEALRQKINEAYHDNKDFKQKATDFLAHARETINPTIGEADIREMLIQHILTEEIFNHVFNEGDFHRENNIAIQLYKLEGAFFTGAIKRDTLKALNPYYAEIRRNAAAIEDHAQKQTFLKIIYENFYKVYNPKAADRLGVVYTPNEIVKFMIEGADWLCHKHFGKALIEPNVEILDPATGTGTFICELLEHFRGQPEKLAHKYKNELHANEVAILPYYVANLNIEATFAAISGQYAEYPNLCFVDTLDNVAALGIRTGQQLDMLAGLSDENIERVKRQNRAKISVIIGNPPYNAWQENFNMRNPNRAYKRIDQAIKDTYIAKGTAQNKNSVYDMYTRFFRWASDRMHDDGVLCFVTNRNFIEKAAYDGFRQIVEQEFDEIYLMDLGGDVRVNPKLSGTKNNVFGIQTGVAISFFVKHHSGRKKDKTPARIYYARRPEFDTKDDKLSFLSSNSIADIKFEHISPSKRHNWINQIENEWDDLIAVASKDEKAGKKGSKGRAIFKLFSSGLKTQRDDWAYDHSRANLEAKMGEFVRVYEETRKDRDNPAKDSIKWDAELESYLTRNISKSLDKKCMLPGLYRPFVKKWAYFDQHFNGRTYQLPSIFPDGAENSGIMITGNGASKPFHNLAFDQIPGLDTLEKTQCLPRYRYSSSGEKIDNITDWALRKFRAAYGVNDSHSDSSPPPCGEGGPKGRVGVGESRQKSSPTGSAVASSASPTSPQGGGNISANTSPAITKDDIFHYVYGVLHDPHYRETYAINLKREFPRIPFYPDFHQWAEWGKQLMQLHIHYEDVAPWPLTRIDEVDEKARAVEQNPRVVLKADKDNGSIRLDSETVLSGIPAEVWDYKLGNRSALEWILDQYKEKTPRDATIREKFNTYRFADYKEKVVDLIMRVTRVSVETMKITEAMRAAKR